MSYEIIQNPPGPRSLELKYEDLGPGLYPDETVVKLDSGELIAVSVAPRWESVTSNWFFTGWARWISNDGTTMTDGYDQEIETVFNHSSDASIVSELTVETIARQILLALLGEPLNTRDTDDGPVYLIQWTDEFLASKNIRNAIQAADLSDPNSLNAASILGE